VCTASCCIDGEGGPELLNSRMRRMVELMVFGADTAGPPNLPSCDRRLYAAPATLLFAIAYRDRFARVAWRADHEQDRIVINHRRGSSRLRPFRRAGVLSKVITNNNGNGIAVIGTSTTGPLNHRR
jgi:hypothetical protein